MNFALCNELFGDLPWSEQCRLTRTYGYTGLEVAPFTLAPRITAVSDQQLREYQHIAQAEGVTLIGLHWLLAKTTGFHLTRADRTIRRATRDYLQALVHACGVWGGGVLVFGSPLQRSLTEGQTMAEAFDRAAEVFREIMPACAAAKVTLCFEPLGTTETNFINTCAAGVTLAQLVDHPQFRLHLDVKAMLGGEAHPPADIIREFAPWMAHFHANDENRLGPGMGSTDFTPIARALREVDYQGWISVEVFDFTPGPEVIARTSLATMQTAFSQRG